MHGYILYGLFSHFSKAGLKLFLSDITILSTLIGDHLILSAAATCKAAIAVSHVAALL